MLLLGVYVAFRFPEQKSVPASTKRWATSYSLFRQGIGLARHSQALLVIFLATLPVNGATGVGRLFQKQLVDIGLPADPVAWFTVIGILALLTGAAALRIVEPRIEALGTARNGYIFACLVGAVGLVALAYAPEALSGSTAILLVTGIAEPLTRTLSTTWVNRETTSEVRATVHSFLAQSEYLGEILVGLAMALVAGLGGISAALGLGAVLFTLTVLLVHLFGAQGVEPKSVSFDPTS
jgi:hypothetical protein